MSFTPPGPPPGRLAELAAQSRTELVNSAVARPIAFSARAQAVWTAARGRRLRGSGLLHVAPGAVVFTASRRTGKRTGASEFVHLEERVIMIEARLAPPWANTFLLLRDQRARARVAVAGSHRRQLRRVLEEADLRLDERVAWRAPSLSARQL